MNLTCARVNTLPGWALITTGLAVTCGWFGCMPNLDPGDVTETVHGALMRRWAAIGTPPPQSSHGLAQELRRNRAPSATIFEKFPLNPVLRIERQPALDSGHAEYPSVIGLGDELWLYYSAFGEAGRWSIAAASSRDGIEWRKRGEVLVPDPDGGTWESGTIAFPSVIAERRASDDARYKLYYAGKGEGPYEAIGLAVSADGRRWRRRGAVLRRGGPGDWDGGEIVDPSVLVTADGYRMYYCGSHAMGALYQVGVALSQDGETWVKHPGNPVFEIERQRLKGMYTVDVLAIGDGFLLFAAAPDSSGFYEISCVHSQDGLRFDAARRRVVLRASHDRSWDHVMVYGMDTLLVGGDVLMWFNGIYRKNTTHGGQIGLARVPLSELLAFLDGDSAALDTTGGMLPTVHPLCTSAR